MKTTKPKVLPILPKLEVIPHSKKKICISTQEGHYIFEKQSIIWLKASGNYTIIYLPDQEIFCAQTLSKLLKKIDLSNFVRIHKSHAINLNMIAFINPSFTSLTLSNNEEVRIARSQKESLKSIIQSLFS